MSAELQTLIFMGFVLKIPVAAMFWIVWWALRNRHDPVEPAGGDDDHGFRRFDRDPRPPGPRRGPHASGDAPLPPGKHGERRRTGAAAPLEVIHHRGGRGRVRERLTR